jgi:hypothetical protein
MKTRVIGCPKTIDGDLKCKEVPTSFGFDTACKVLDSQPLSIITICFTLQTLLYILNLSYHSHGTLAQLVKSVLSAEGIITTFQYKISENQS